MYWAAAAKKRTISQATIGPQTNQPMPIYEYQPSGPVHCEYCRTGFEVRQKINDARLSACPQCGAPAVRRVSAPSLSKSGPSLDPSNIEKHGFTQYRKAGKGVYEKTAGKGPDTIKGD